jgi:hypothetical protein
LSGIFVRFANAGANAPSLIEQSRHYYGDPVPPLLHTTANFHAAPLDVLKISERLCA